MKLYHGTNNAMPIINGEMRPGTWLAENIFHAFRIAERRKKQRGGGSVVVEIEIDRKLVHREMSRNIATYRYCGGSYKSTHIHEMKRSEIK